MYDLNQLSDKHLGYFGWQLASHDSPARQEADDGINITRFLF